MERPDGGEDELGGKKALHHEAAYSHEQGEACHNREFVSKREGFCPDERLEVLAMQTCFLEPAMQAVGAACKAEPRCEVKGNGRKHRQDKTYRAQREAGASEGDPVAAFRSFHSIPFE